MTGKRVTCILCPNGCVLDVTYGGEPTAETIAVEGNLCPRGREYAIDEVLHPKRTLTTSVSVIGGDEPLVSVRTASPIPRSLIKEAREALRGIAVQAPVAIGDVIVRNVVGTGVDVIATRAVDRV